MYGVASATTRRTDTAKVVRSGTAMNFMTTPPLHSKEHATCQPNSTTERGAAIMALESAKKTRRPFPRGGSCGSALRLFRGLDQCPEQVAPGENPAETVVAVDDRNGADALSPE